jgi:hypothetical protein
MLYSLNPLGTLHLARVLPSCLARVQNQLKLCSVFSATTRSTITFSSTISISTSEHTSYRAAQDLTCLSHITHHLLAIYALGASPDLLASAYKNEEGLQRAAFPSPGEITHENYADHIGEEKWYQAYFNFFAQELLSKGVSKTLDEYVFSKKANYEGDAEREGRKPKEMFSRFIGGLLHPLIHLGYGLEFGIPYMVTEGG